MKFKTKYFSTLLLVLVFFVSCGGDKESSNNTDNTDIEATEIEIPEYNIDYYPDLKFYAGFPNDPTKSESNGITMLQYVHQTEAFFIGVSKTGDKKVNLDEVLKIAASAILNPDTVIYGEVKTAGGIVGKELVLMGNLPSMSAYFAAQVFEHNGRIYQLSVITNGEEPPLERITAFWNAFKLD